MPNEPEEVQRELKLHFHGPFSFAGGEHSVFISPVSDRPCIYIWTMKYEGANYIHYIGETKKSFLKRQLEHLRNILGMEYGLYDVQKTSTGVLQLIWNGFGINRNIKKREDLSNTILAAYESRNAEILEYVRGISIFSAPIYIEDGLRRHLEGCIGWSLRDNHKEYSSLYPLACRCNKGKMLGKVLYVTCDEPIMGLDEYLNY